MMKNGSDAFFYVFFGLLFIRLSTTLPVIPDGELCVLAETQSNCLNVECANCFWCTVNETSGFCYHQTSDGDGDGDGDGDSNDEICGVDPIKAPCGGDGDDDDVDDASS